jgi:hypothetical protein
MDIEAQMLEEESAVKVNPTAFTNGYESYAAKSGSLIDSELDFLGGLSYNRRREGLAKWFPWLFPDNLAQYNGSVLGSASGTNTHKSTFQKLCPWLDENARRQQEFMVEMRLLSRLRHPCKYLLSWLVWHLNHYEEGVQLTSWFSCIQYFCRHHDGYGSCSHSWPTTNDGDGVSANS